MKVVRIERIDFVTYGPNKLFDLTSDVERIAENVEQGWAALQAVGSTGALLIMPGAREVVKAFEHDLWDLVPTLGWLHPGNAYAHLRSTLIGTMLVVPVKRGKLELEGCKVFFLENQPAVRRRRAVIVAVLDTS